MRSMVRFVMMGVGALALAGSALAATMPWAASFKEAKEMAAKQNKMIFVDFEAEWCGWCKKMDKDTYSDEKVIAAVTKNYIPVKLDAEKNDEGVALAKQHKVDGFPTIKFFDKNGDPIATQVGYSGPTDFITKLDQVKKDYAEFPTLVEKAKNGTDMKAVARLANIYLTDRNNPAEAMKLLEMAEKKNPTNKNDELTDLYMAFSDHYMRDDPKKSIAYLNKVASTTKSAEKRYRSKLNIVVAHFYAEDFASAKKQAQALVDDKKTPKEYRDEAQQALEYLKEMEKSKAAEKTK